MNSEWIFPDNWQVLMTALCNASPTFDLTTCILIARMIFSKGRRTITRWFRCVGISRHYKAFYYFIGTLGRKTEIVAMVLFECMVHLFIKTSIEN